MLRYTFGGAVLLPWLKTPKLIIAHRMRDNQLQQGHYVILATNAFVELEATLGASGIEAEIAHDLVTRGYITRCRACA